MTDLEKLKHLLQHWREHNDDHVRTYNEWAAKAENIGKNDLSLTIKEMANISKNLDELFIKAAEMIQ